MSVFTNPSSFRHQTAHQPHVMAEVVVKIKVRTRRIRVKGIDFEHTAPCLGSINDTDVLRFGLPDWSPADNGSNDNSVLILNLPHMPISDSLCINAVRHAHRP